MFNILIRRLSLADASISFRWRNDPEVWKYTSNKPNKLITKEIEKNWLEKKLAEKNSSSFAIIVDNQYIGNIQITDIIERDKGQYHIFIGEKSFWGKGIAKQATAQIIRFAKEELKLKELYLIVNPSHLSAIKLYETSGFIKVNDEIRMRLNLLEIQPPIVSVFIMTYNHEKFIADALEGILTQKANFDFDIVIGEDCSTDDTRNIVLEYAQKYPGKFKLLLNEHNIGANANQIAVLQSCTGKYLALCEGDDYWNDPYKLQKQVDFLEKNPDYGLCYGDIIVVDESNYLLARDPSWKALYKSGYVFTDLFNQNFIPTLTVVVRKKLMDSALKSLRIYPNLKVFDYWFWLYISMFTKFKFFDEKMAVYRDHSKSITNSKEFNRENFLQFVYLIKINIIENYCTTSNKIRISPGINEKLFFLKKVMQLFYKNHISFLSRKTRLKYLIKIAIQ